MKAEHCKGLRSCDSPGDLSLQLAVFECPRFQHVQTKLSVRLPPESLGKCKQQHLCPLILDHHSTLGDFSADVIVSGER